MVASSPPSSASASAHGISEPELKQAAESVLKELGLTPTEAITLFYTQVTLRHGLPFTVELPNVETRAAMQDAVDGLDLTEWQDLESLKAAYR